MAIPQHRDADRTRARLQDWLGAQIPGATETEVSGIEIPKSGFSNETFYFNAAWNADGEYHHERLVARVQPAGHQLFLNPDVFLQSSMMSALGTHSKVPVPTVFAEERDPAVLGAPFYVMRYVDGRVASEVPSYHTVGWVADLPPRQRERFYLNAMAAFAEVPKADWHEGFDFLAGDKRGSSLDRYLQWVEEWYTWAAAGRPMGVIEEGIRFVLERRPPQRSEVIIWGDSRPGNMIIREDLSVAAVIDWEMAAIGPREVDLGWWLFWERFLTEGNNTTRLDGIPGRDETIAVYESLVGAKVEDIEYYEILGAVRMAITSTRFLTSLAASIDFPYDASIHTTNGASQVLARYLSLPVPPTSPAYVELVKALRR